MPYVPVPKDLTTIKTKVAFKRPKFRPYQTNNLYAALERQSKLDKEVNIIVKSEHRKK